MFYRASLVAAAALALAACGGTGSDNLVGTQLAAVDDGSTDTGTGDTGDGSGDTLTCDDARAAFDSCRTAAEPTCAPIAQQLRDCVDAELGGDTGTEPPPPPAMEEGDDEEGSDDGDVATPEDGGGCPGRHHDGDRDGGRDGGHRMMPEACQPIADQLHACMSTCADAHEAMHQACRPEAPEASACTDAIAAAQACIDSHDDCDQGPGSTCFTECGPVVEQARNTCAGEMGGHHDGDRMEGDEGGHHHHHGDRMGDDDGAGSDDDDGSDDDAGSDDGSEA